MIIKQFVFIQINEIFLYLRFKYKFRDIACHLSRDVKYTSNNSTLFHSVRFDYLHKFIHHMYKYLIIFCNLYYFISFNRHVYLNFINNILLYLQSY